MRKVIILIGLVFGLIACEDIVGTPDISGQKVTIIAPVNNVIIDTLTTTFAWEALEDAVIYHLQVATPNFANAMQVVVDTNLTKLNHTKTLSNSGDYEWRIRAENSGYVTDYTTQQFTIEE